MGREEGSSPRHIGKYRDRRLRPSFRQYRLLLSLASHHRPMYQACNLSSFAELVMEEYDSLGRAGYGECLIPEKIVSKLPPRS